MDHNTVWVFDNDGTLYKLPEGFEQAITRKMIDVIAKLYSAKPEEIMARRQELFQKYKIRSTLLVFCYEGIIQEQEINDFIQRTYLSVDPRSFGITTDLRLRRILKRLGTNLFVHTNNPSAFADSILYCLGIRDLFSEIYGMFENGKFQKPDVQAFGKLLCDVKNYNTRWYIDNEVQNLITAQKLGFKTIAVAEASSTDEVETNMRVKNLFELFSK